MPRIRYLVVAAALATACESETFDLLPVAAEGGQSGTGHEGGEGGDAPPASGVGGSGLGGASSGGAASGGKAPTGGSFGTGGYVAGTSGTGTKPDGLCEDSDDCEQYGSFNKCHPDWEVCVQCYEEDHCGVDYQCEFFSGVCQKRCDADADCPLYRPHCLSDICVECGEQAHCKDEDEPVCRAFSCLPCRTDLNGEDDCPEGKHCYRGRCELEPAPQPRP
jgi:hypothetical protein